MEDNKTKLTKEQEFVNKIIFFMLILLTISSLAIIFTALTIIPNTDGKPVINLNYKNPPETQDLPPLPAITDCNSLAKQLIADAEDYYQMVCGGK